MKPDNTSPAVLFLINALKVGGAERVFVRTANELSRRGISVHIALLYGTRDDSVLQTALDPAVKVIYLHARNFFDLSAIRKLIAYMRAKSITAIYSTLDESNIIARFLKLLYPRARIIIREANVAGPKPLQFKLLDIMCNFLVSCIVCVSTEVKKSLMNYQSIYTSKMEVLPNGVVVPDIAKEYAHSSSPIEILTVGSLTPKKGQRFLLEAAAILKREEYNFHLSLIGKGSELDMLKVRAGELDIADRVTFLGELSASEVAKKYQSADIFVLSSLWEGSPNVLLEAMSYGLAVVSTKVSGAADMIEDKVSGILVEVGSAGSLAEGLQYVLDHRDHWAPMGTQARKRIVEKFSFAVYTERLLKLLQLS